MKVLISLMLTVIMVCTNINYLAIDSMAAAKPPSIKIATQHIKIGDKKKLTVTSSTPAITKNAKYTWKSSRKDIVSISKTGVITGISEGKSKITVETKYKKKTLKASCYVNVTELKNMEITASSVKKGKVSLKNDTFDSIIVKKEAGAAKINLSGVTVLSGMILEEGSESKIAATNSKIDYIEVEANSKDKQPSITLSKNCMVNECRLKGNANIVLKDKSTIKSMKVSPAEEKRLALTLNGFKGTLSLNGEKSAAVNVGLSNCSITDADIISNSQPFAVDLKNIQGSAIEKVQSDKWVDLKMGVPAEFITINAKNNLKVQSETTTAPTIKITGLEVYNKAVIQKIINYEDDMSLDVDSGKIMEFITYANKTKVTMKSAEGTIHNVTVNGNEASLTGSGSIIYVKLNGNNSFVNVLETKVEVGTGTTGNKAGQSNLKPEDIVIVKELGNQNSSIGGSGSSGGSGNSGGGNPNPPVDPENPIDPPPVLSKKLNTPTGIGVKLESGNKYTINWNLVNFAQGYKVAIYNESDNNKKELEQLVSDTEFAVPLSGTGVNYRIGITAMGDNKLHTDSEEGTHSFVAGTAGANTQIVIDSCVTEDVVSKASGNDKDVSYKLSLDLKWHVESGITPTSFLVEFKNTSTNKITSVDAGTATSLRGNQYITEPNVTYAITVIPVLGGVNGTLSNIFYYTTVSVCGHNEKGSFLWKDTNSLGFDVYAITTKEQVEHIREHQMAIDPLGTTGMVMILLNNIDFYGATYTKSICGDWQQSGLRVDGQGFMLDNFTINSSENLVGIFGYTGIQSGTQIKDFGVGKNVFINSTASNAKVGSISAVLYGNAERCYSFATVTANSSNNVGGLFGEEMHGLKESYFKGSVTNSGSGNTGGLVGQAGAVVMGSYNAGTVKNTGGGYTGGIIGVADNAGKSVGRANQCYALVYPIGGQVGKTGGLVGRVEEVNATPTGVINSFLVSTDDAHVLAGNITNATRSQKVSLAQLRESSTLNILNYTKPSVPIYSVDATLNRPTLINNPERKLN